MELEKKLKHYRINKEEYDTICGLLKRPPEGVEWALFSALWSEHCSYKSSRVHLKNLYNKSPRVVMSFGENAGVIDLGEGEKVAFKMESHNHPSFIEPYQGAATGVGGILRDIFTMGARPVALANYLCFGEPDADRMTALVDGVVRGIGGYGNCVGVPTITGQTEFHKSYNKNILVNALAVGVFGPNDPILSSKARGVGNDVVYVGAKTGKDGVHGASMASESFDDKTESKKPTIQKGDPFFEKLLIESCLEVMKLDLVESIQDMGAAGLTSSSFEMAAKGEVGLDLYLDQVPLRDSTMVPEEILLSESQERMLMIVKPENFEKVRQVFDKWDLDAEKIGVVTARKSICLFWHGEKICEIDPLLLTDNAPMYKRPYDEWKPKNHVAKWDSVNAEIKSGLKKILKDIRGCCRSWVYNQYDQRVGAQTAADASESVGVVRLKDSGRALGLVLGCRPALMRMDAQVGAIDSIAYPSLELAAKGFLPLAATDCLNFGNPEQRPIMSEFVATIQGMSAMCEALSAPIISGNVSFYNETMGNNITSTPGTGIVGLRQTISKLPVSHFTEANQEIFLLDGSTLRTNAHFAELENQDKKFSGHHDIKKWADLIHVARHLALAQGVLSSRVVGKFGLPYALARMCTSQLGCDIPELALNFDEHLYQVIFVVRTEKAHEFRTLFQSLTSDLKLERIGTTITNIMKWNGKEELSLKEISELYNTRWETLLDGLS